MTYRVLIPFTVKTKQGDLTLNPGQAVVLAEEKANVLLRTGKIEPLPNKITAFEQSVYRINKQYRAGAIVYCRQRHPDAYKKTIEVENRLNAIWDKGTDPAEFKKALGEWESIHLELLRLFEKS